MQKERPLSPHLQVYRPQLTSMLSILHRATGVFLTLGTVLLVFWLAAIAAGPQAYDTFQSFSQHWLMVLVLIGWAFSLFYHSCNGIRHLFWDAGHGFEMKSLYQSGWAVLMAAVLLTAITVYLAMGKMGGGL